MFKSQMEDIMGNNKTPLLFVRRTIIDKISNRSTELVNKAQSGEITQQAYLAQQFPADAIQFIEKALEQAVKDFNKASKASKCD
jgi:hypothetical protein